MPRKRRIIDKKAFKQSCGKCALCGEARYELLDTHRITPGSKGGKYTADNSVCLCSNCHRRVHAGEVDIHRYYESTVGRVLHITEDNEEKYLSQHIDC